MQRLCGFFGGFFGGNSRSNVGYIPVRMQNIEDGIQPSTSSHISPFVTDPSPYNIWSGQMVDQVNKVKCFLFYGTLIACVVTVCNAVVTLPLKYFVSDKAGGYSADVWTVVSGLLAIFMAIWLYKERRLLMTPASPFHRTDDTVTLDDNAMPQDNRTPDTISPIEGYCYYLDQIFNH